MGIRWDAELEVHRSAFNAAMEVFQISRAFPKEETDSIALGVIGGMINHPETWVIGGESSLTLPPAHLVTLSCSQSLGALADVPLLCVSPCPVILLTSNSGIGPRGMIGLASAS
jgi:hypothetical protein